MCHEPKDATCCQLRLAGEMLTQAVRMKCRKKKGDRTEAPNTKRKRNVNKNCKTTSAMLAKHAQ